MSAQQEIRSIPSLDGLRAISVLVVIMGHTHSAVLDRIPFNESFRNGSQGVLVFFGISGFLITHLLLKELRRNQGISLGRFYLRRTMRIFPPFYVFLIVVAIASRIYNLNVGAQEMVAAATYTWNYYAPVKTYWLLDHCWSLALEEQFYLLWPLCMAFFSRRTNLAIAIGVIMLSPLSRAITYLTWPAMRGHIDMMLHTHLDAIMTGCLLSLIIELDIWRQFRKVAQHPAAPIAAIIFMVAIDTPARIRWAGKYLLIVGFSLENVAVAILLLFCVFRPHSMLGRFLNMKWLRHIGVISYSLYLWQEFFTGPYTRWFPLNIACIFACAELSFWLIEKPSYAVRNKLERLLFPA